MRLSTPVVSLVALSWIGLSGCGGHQPQIVQNAPPVSAPAPPVQVQPVAEQGVYNWREVPAGERVPISRAVFDQGGYQLFSPQGTIAVPFENQNLYVMKFGRTSGQMYFVNEGGAPILYLPNGGYLENAAAQGARWFPLPNDYAYTRPVYVGVAPSWGEYLAMGWYPGMVYYGGMWGYNPFRVAWMPNFYITLGGARYNDYTVYQNYYRSNVNNRVYWNNANRFNYNQRSSGSWSGSRNANNRFPSGSSGFGRSNNNGFNRSGSSRFGSGASGSAGSFGNGRRSGSTGFGNSSGFGTSGGRSGFGSSSGSSGSSGFGSSGTRRSTFGSGSGSGFGSGSSGFGSGGRSSSSSFGGTRGFGSSGRSSGSSFGSSSGGRSGSSFGGSTRSSGSSGSSRRR